MLSWLMQSLAETTAAVTFFAIFLGGVVFSLMSIVFGGHGEGDHDAGGDFGGDHDIGHDGNAEHDGGEHGDGDSHGISPSMILSVRGMALLATGFGGVSFLVQVNTGKVLFSSFSGLIAGYVFAIGILYALKALTTQQANSLIHTEKSVGTIGVVTTSIPKGEVGEVRLVVSGVEMVKTATSIDGSPIKSGAPVIVERVDGGTLVVSVANQQRTRADHTATQNSLSS